MADSVGVARASLDASNRMSATIFGEVTVERPAYRRKHNATVHPPTAR